MGDEAVAYGAAVQAGVLAGTSPDNVVLLDVTPISLGIETNGGIFDKMIPRNSALPVTKSKSFVTSTPDSSDTHIIVYEGERKMVKDNNKLGNFILSGFPKGPAGISHEVTFDVDANGIMKVSAKITQSGKENSMTITKDKQRLTSEQIEEMIKDADLYAEEDSKAEAAAKQKGEVDKFTKDTEYKMGKSRSMMSEDEIKTVQDKLAEARELADYKDPEGSNPNFKAVTSLLTTIK